MNATLYGTFAVFGCLSGALFNIFGTKALMSMGASTYAFYAFSVYMWGQVNAKYAPMAITASAILGLGAACLWGAQGTVSDMSIAVHLCYFIISIVTGSITALASISIPESR